MKYIRTKDGISAIEEEIIECVIKPNNIQYRQADTIQELCDEFDIIIPAGIYRYGIYHMRLEGYGDFIRTWKEYKEKHGNDWSHFEMIGAYGAIWTDKGLIYVARMNDKGELDLL